jgi:hypothetical protein
MKYTLVSQEEGSNLTVYVPGKPPLLAHSSHPHWEKLRDGVLANDETVLALFDLAKTAGTKFEHLSERITVAHGKLYVDGVEMHNALSEQVIRFIEEDVDDWKPLVNFFEKLLANPNEHSREQLYGWIEEQKITINDDGMMVGYKGVRKKGDTYYSVNGGKAIVNGEVVEGQIPNAPGSVVSMPRTEVMHNPRQDCDAGLHVGSFEYASGFGDGTVLEILVNPRDVVSVPDASWKLRTCRYEVVRVIEKPHSAAVVHTTTTNKKENKTKVTTAVKPLKVSKTKAKQAVKQYGSVDAAAKALGYSRDPFRVFARQNGISATK